MDYADSLREVLIRKINRAERDLSQLKMDYCRFVYGISHRSRVRSADITYQIKSVDLESMQRMSNGEWTRPAIFGVRLDDKNAPATEVAEAIDESWVAVR